MTSQPQKRFWCLTFSQGVGGLPRALERAGAAITHMVTVEKDKDLRRCHRRAWPGAEEKSGHLQDDKRRA